VLRRIWAIKLSILSRGEILLLLKSENMNQKECTIKLVCNYDKLLSSTEHYFSYELHTRSSLAPFSSGLIPIKILWIVQYQSIDDIN